MYTQKLIAIKSEFRMRSEIDECFPSLSLILENGVEREGNNKDYSHDLNGNIEETDTIRDLYFPLTDHNVNIFNMIKELEQQYENCFNSDTDTFKYSKLIEFQWNKDINHLIQIIGTCDIIGKYKEEYFTILERDTSNGRKNWFFIQFENGREKSMSLSSISYLENYSLEKYNRDISFNEKIKINLENMKTLNWNIRRKQMDDLIIAANQLHNQLMDGVTYYNINFEPMNINEYFNDIELKTNPIIDVNVFKDLFLEIFNDRNIFIPNYGMGELEINLREFFKVIYNKNYKNDLNNYTPFENVYFDEKIYNLLRGLLISKKGVVSLDALIECIVHNQELYNKVVSYCKYVEEKLAA